MQLLPGFRDFYPEDCARRNYILAQWREVARRYGFVEYDGPMLEPIELYKKKSGGELVGQLFDFADKGERHVAMRPEMTPTLARMVAARERDFKKPLKWFCAPQFFRYEKQQRGRLREFYQFNADIIGEAGPAADAELIALGIDLLRSFGFTEKDFIVRLSSREIWGGLLRDRMGTCEPADLQEFLAVLDKIDRQEESAINAKLTRFKTTAAEVRQWAETSRLQLLDPAFDPSSSENYAQYAALHQLLHNHLSPRGLLPYVDVDFTIIRGLAYYKGLVFEIFDRSKKERALAGGGRYDDLLSVMSDGRVDLPALGFGMGDVVLANLIQDTPAAKAQMESWIAKHHAADVYVIIAREERRPEGLAIVQQLRGIGCRVDFPMGPAKVGKQFQTAEHLGARVAVLVGDELDAGQVKLKTFATREELLIPREELEEKLRALLGR